MKANELMIGDIVRVAKDVCFKKGTIVKIHGIDAEHVFSEKGLKGVASCMPANDPSECTSGVWVEYLEPIPLTAEVLEKNGIKWLCTEPSGRKTYCCNEPVVQCTYIPNSGWLINVGACGSIKVRFVEVSKIQYVHQLQHALILCGIKKEIELW